MTKKKRFNRSVSRFFQRVADRRGFSHTAHIPERRSGQQRRKNPAKRSKKKED